MCFYIANTDGALLRGVQMDLKCGELSPSGTEQPQADRLSSLSGHVCALHTAVIDTVVVMPLLTCDRQTYRETKEVKEKGTVRTFTGPFSFLSCQRLHMPEAS